MSKITLHTIGSIPQNPTSAMNAINDNSDIIQTAMDNTLSRDGTSPNQMENNIDMNDFQILNLPAPATGLSPLRLQDLSDFTGGGTVTNIPVGGTTGQTLAKTSNVDYAVSWQNNVQSVGLALPADFTVTNSPVTGTGTLTGAWANTPTGTGGVVRANSPTLINPALGTPASGTLTSCTGLPVSTGISGLATGVATFLATPSSGNLRTVLTDETGTGFAVFATSPTITTPTIATSLTFSPTTGGIVGTTTNDNTTAGNVGEFASSIVALGSAVSLTTTVPANVTSISLTAGDWDLRGVIHFTGGATTTVSFLRGSLSSTTATEDVTVGHCASVFGSGSTMFSSIDMAYTLPKLRVSVASTTTYFLVGRANFSVSTCSVYGGFFARRIR